jgi:hypothetical protein
VADSEDVDVRSMYDSEYVAAWDLQGKDQVVTIAKVVPGELSKAGTSKKDRAAIVFFEGRAKGMVVNKTNRKLIGGIVGSFRAKSWVGARITIFPTTCQFGPNTVDCIRVRPTAPNGKAAAREPGSEG